MDEFLTVAMVAKRLGISLQAVYRLLERGTLRSRRIGRQRMVHRDWVAKLQQDPDYQARSERANRWKNGGGLDA